MEEDDEEMLRDEVIYLHSLWHRGPPPQPPQHHHHHPPPPQPPQHHHHPPPQPPQHHHLLHLVNPPLFKKQKPSKRPKDSVEISTTKWACPPSPPPKSPSLPSFKPTQFPSNADVQLSSPKLESWAAGKRIHHKVVKEVARFFKTKINGSDNDDDDEEMEMDDDGDDSEDKNGGYFGFFLELFEENEDLMSFYEDNYENGEFGCLVCGGVGVIRRFKDCVALVQHTQSISKTKTLKAHRAFGEVVCIVLGWDVNKLPSSISEKKKETLSKLEEGQPRMQEKLTNEAGDVRRDDKEAEGAEQLLDDCELAVAENLQSAPGVGGYANDQIKEIRNGKQENAESASD